MPVVKTDRPANKSIILQGCTTKMVTGLQNELDGVLVVSIEQAVAAPYCGLLLADSGARVLKIERPEGDFARGYDKGADGQSSIFIWLNRGKESVCIDLSELLARATAHDTCTFNAVGLLSSRRGDAHLETRARAEGRTARRTLLRLYGSRGTEHRPLGLPPPPRVVVRL